MVPVQVPIIDYENPFYCSNPHQFHSVDVSDSDVHRSTSPFSQNSAATLAYSHQGVKTRNFDTDTSSPGIYAHVYGQDGVTSNNLRQERLVGRKFARISYDSSPCARFLASSDEKGPPWKRTRYTRFAGGSFRIPDDEWKETCGIKQEASSAVSSTFPDQDEHIHKVSKEHVPECDLGNTVTTRTLLLRLDNVFPGIGFREAADSVQNIWKETNAQYRSERHQSLIDLLGEKGALNEYVLTIVYDAEVSSLELGPTLRGVNKLSLPLGDIMRAFSQPGRFQHLRTLSFAGGRFRDDLALACIRPLSQIEKLVLANTGIGNEGVFHIVALKHKLRYLDLSGNLSIDDDSIPALILFENLRYLSVSGTGVLMPGLRKLAVAVKRGERVIDVKIPTTCKDYIDEMHKQYLLHPAPPLISDPDVTSMLSKGALARNLEAHAAINSSIVAVGPRNEMEERLRKILEVRNHDLVVQDMLVGLDSDGER